MGDPVGCSRTVSSSQCEVEGFVQWLRLKVGHSKSRFWILLFQGWDEHGTVPKWSVALKLEELEVLGKEKGKSREYDVL